MSAAALIDRAARGELPAWAVVSPDRRAHAARVAMLMDTWAVALGLSAGDRLRWRAAAWLHDALRDAKPETLRPLIASDPHDLPDPMLHGPAAASRLEADGVDDPPLLAAIAWHTIGHPTLDRLGQMLYVADFLEPGRPYQPVWRAARRARMPAALQAVLVEVAAARLDHLLDSRRAIRPESLAFWNSVVARQ